MGSLLGGFPLCAEHVRQLGGVESPSQPDGGEMIAHCKGVSREGASERSVSGANVRADVQEPDLRHPVSGERAIDREALWQITPTGNRFGNLEFFISLKIRRTSNRFPYRARRITSGIRLDPKRGQNSPSRNRSLDSSPHCIRATNGLQLVRGRHRKGSGGGQPQIPSQRTPGPRQVAIGGRPDCDVPQRY